MNRSIQKAICRILVRPLERTFTSNPPSTIGITQSHIMAYEIYSLAVVLNDIPNILFSRLKFCRLNAAIQVSMSMIPSTTFAILICESEGRFIISPKSFIIIEVFINNLRVIA